MAPHISEANLQETSFLGIFKLNSTAYFGCLMPVLRGFNDSGLNCRERVFKVTQCIVRVFWSEKFSSGPRLEKKMAAKSLNSHGRFDHSTSLLQVARTLKEKMTKAKEAML